MRCKAKTKHGYACRASAIRGSSVCLFHATEWMNRKSAKRREPRKK